jgi:hypothetical protein
MNIRLTSVIIAMGALAGCGSGSGSGASAPQIPAAADAAPSSGSGSTVAAQGTTTRLTFTIDRAPDTLATQSALRAELSARRSNAANRSPQFISAGIGGLQVTIASGAATQTLYYAATTSSPVCSVNAGSVETCTLSVPTLGATETISAIEVDNAPNNESMTTGQGTAFPANSRVLAIGSETLTLTPGVVNAVSLSLDPVIDQLIDFARMSRVFSNNIAVDAVLSYLTPFPSPRIIVTPNTSGSSFANPAGLDATGYFTKAVVCTTNPTSSCTGQPFADVDGSLVPVAVTSNSAAITVYPIPIYQLPNYYGDPFPAPLPTPPFSQTASIVDSSLFYYAGCCGGMLDVAYSGAALSGGETITVTNNLIATPPTFTGAPVGSAGAQTGPYTASLTYNIVTISAAPAMFSFASTSAAAQVVTGTDPGATTAMLSANAPANSSVVPTADTSCVNGGMTIATIVAGAFAGGIQQFTISPAAAGTCSFVLIDSDTNVVTNTVSVTVL